MDKTESINYFLADNSTINFKFIFHTLAQFLARFEERTSYINRVSYIGFNPVALNHSVNQAEAWLEHILSAAERFAEYINLIGLANPELQERIEQAEVNVLLVEPQSLAEVIALGTDFDIKRKNITVLTSREQLGDDYAKHRDSLPLEVDGIHLEVYPGGLGSAIAERSLFTTECYDLVIAEKAPLETVIMLLQQLLKGKFLSEQGALVFRTFHKLKGWNQARGVVVDEWDEAKVLEALFAEIATQQNLASTRLEAPRKGISYAHLRKQLPPVIHNELVLGNPSAHAIVGMFDIHK